MRNIKLTFLTMLMALFALPAFAQDFTYEGITYTVLDEEAKTCKTKDGSFNSSIPGNTYTGELTIPAIVNSGSQNYTVVEIGSYGFMEQELTSVILPETLKVINSYAFFSCPNLASINFPDSLLAIGAFGFCGCSSLTSVELPELLTTIEEGVFGVCENLSSISLPKSLTTIGLNSFSSCEKLTSIEFPNSLTKIGDGAFSACYGLTNLTLPESLKTLGIGTFSDCVGLESVYLPASLDSIGALLFNGCRGFSSVTYNATNPINAIENVFESTVYKDAILEMPNAALADVQATVPWNLFTQIHAKDGSITPALPAGQDFEYNGITYTVIDSDSKTCKTKDGDSFNEIPGNKVTGIINIPSKVSDGSNEYTVVEIGNYAFCNCDSVTSISLPASVTALGDYAFSGCGSLTSINIPDSVTVISNGVFLRCSSLTSITLPEGITSLKTNAFSQCGSLASINIPHGITSIGNNAFYHCSNLTSISIPASVVTIGTDAFNNCDSLTKAEFASIEALCNIDFGDLYANPLYYAHDLYINNEVITEVVIPETVTRLNYTFVRATGLTSVKIPDTVKELGICTFYGCSALTSVNIPDGVKSLKNSMFQSCTSLLTINIPESVTEIEASAFYNCTSLETVHIPENVTIIRPSAFSCCSALTSVTLPAALTSLGERAFFNCKALTAVTYLASSPLDTSAGFDIFQCSEGFSDGMGIYENATLNMPYALLADIQTSIPWYLFKHIVAKDGTVEPEPEPEPEPGLAAGEDFEYEGIKYTVIDAEANTCETKAGTFKEAGNPVEGNIVIPSQVSDGSKEYSVVNIGDYSFSNCENLTSMTLPETLTTIGNSAFFRCKTLPSITIPSKVVSIGSGAFSFCDELKKADFASIESLCNIKFEDLNSNPLRYAETLYINGTEVSDIEIAGAVTEIKDFAFIYARNLNSVNISASVTSIGNESFASCTGLTSVSLPETLLTIGTSAFQFCESLISINLPESITSIQPYAFGNCQSLTSISLPSSIDKIEGHVFSGCWALTSVVIPETITSIGEMAFDGCKSLPTINIPETVASIGSSAFRNCESLKTFTLPAGLTSLENYAFTECMSLKTFIYEASTPITGPETIFQSRDNQIYNTCTLEMPNAVLADIQATVPWNLFKKIVAKDGSVGMGLAAGEDFEYEGIIYTVIDPENRTCETRAGSLDESGNSIEGDAVIPEIVFDDTNEYSVVGIGEHGFYDCNGLTSILLPASMTSVATDAFENCHNLTSIAFEGDLLLDFEAIEKIGNKNLMIYVNRASQARLTLNKNIAVRNGESGEYECTNLVLTPGYPFKPIYAFNASHSSLTKEFTQETPIEGCAGWETLVLPFDVTDITASDSRSLTPFANFVKTSDQCPFWLYEANSNGGWLESSQIKAGVPYIISMPNNGEYDAEYCISGDVTFSSSNPMSITPETTAPYAVTWASGREFRSLWTPLTEEEAANAMGLNVGISDLVGDNGEVLAPGSAFHVGVVPQPLEAYVTRIDGQRAMKIGGGQSSVLLIDADRNLDVRASYGTITVTSATDRTLDICTTDGMRIRTLDLKAGETVTVTDLTKGIYIVANRKVTVK